MENKIIDLSTNNSKTRNIYNIEKQQVDMGTGQVFAKENISVKQFIKQDDFIQFFVENLAFLTNLESSEKATLFGVLAKMDYGNIISINASTRKNLMGRTGLSKATISRGISGLIDKKILLFINTEDLKDKYKVFDDHSYLVNPNVVGKGSFKELKRLRQMVVTDFNFDKQEVTREIIRETEFEGFNNIKENLSNYEIKAVEQKNDEETKSKNTTVIIDKIQNNELSLFAEEDKKLGAFWLAGGSVSGVYGEKTAKEMKRELLDEEYMKEEK